MSYRKYDPMVKEMIIKTGNRNLFPELKIPRTTINYWLKNKGSLVHSADCEDEISKLKKENFLLQKSFKQLMKHIKDIKVAKENRKDIVDVVEEIKNIIPLSESLSILKIPPTSYYRWKAEFHGCKYRGLKSCPVKRGNQLSRKEQKTLFKYATSKKFKMYSTRSLVYYCQRNKILSCGLETWYKYLKYFGIERNKGYKKRRIHRIGIRSKRPNEIWHIDITIIPFGKNERAYLQLIVDNYSRKNISHTLSYKRDKEISIRSLKKAFSLRTGFNDILMSDKGGENKNLKVKNFLLGRGITQLFAKSDVSFSNSIVEAVFRQLKQRFIRGIKMNTLTELRTRIRKFVKKYNNEIPHSSLDGLTPSEAFSQKINANLVKEELIEFQTRSRQQRYRANKKCNDCIDRFKKDIAS